MQSVWERYSLVASAGSLSLKPYVHRVKRARCLLVVAVLIAACTPVAARAIGEDGCAVLYALSICLVLQGLYDSVVKASICYTFDAATNGIYKSSLVQRYKKLMRLDEAIVFVNDANGGWHYAVSTERTQFVTSYTISEEFDPGYESQRRLQVYEADILGEINAMIVKQVLNGHCLQRRDGLWLLRHRQSE